MNSTLPKPFVFVLMPFNDDFDDVYKLGIKPACETAGAYAERVDEQIFDGSILDRIYNQISKADLIIADMTGRNPNVFYEVGYAHALGKPVVHLTQDSNDIPFDLKHYSHIIYGKKISDLIPLLEKQLAHRLSHGGAAVSSPASSLRFHWQGQELADGAALTVLDKSPPVRTLAVALDVHNTIAREINVCAFKAGLLCGSRFEHCRGLVWGTGDKKRQFLHKISQPDGRALFLLPDSVELSPDEWTTVLFEPVAATPGVRAGEEEGFVLRVFTSAGTSDLHFTITLEVRE